MSSVWCGYIHHKKGLVDNSAHAHRKDPQKERKEYKLVEKKRGFCAYSQHAPHRTYTHITFTYLTLPQPLWLEALCFERGVLTLLVESFVVVVVGVVQLVRVDAVPKSLLICQSDMAVIVIVVVVVVILVPPRLAAVCVPRRCSALPGFCPALACRSLATLHPATLARPGGGSQAVWLSRVGKRRPWAV